MNFSQLLKSEIDKKKDKTPKGTTRRSKRLLKKSDSKNDDFKNLVGDDAKALVKQEHLKEKSEILEGGESIDVSGSKSELQDDLPILPSDESIAKSVNKLDSDLNPIDGLNSDNINEDLKKLINSLPSDQVDEITNLLKIDKYRKYLSLELQLKDSPLIKQDVSLNNLQTLSIKIRIYLKNLIKLWESLNESLSLLREIKVDFVELLYKLRTNSLPSDMIISLSTIILHLQQHQFNQANEAYLKLSIGNVAWPIGIRNVGIHERAADAKLVSKRANIMISDKTRRWLVGIKRCISWVEKNFKI